jgi:2-succinyl-5-enolpyruvyl-6-hydroxy-3-cyclohexene-1-carboxylate synthase
VLHAVTLPLHRSPDVLEAVRDVERGLVVAGPMRAVTTELLEVAARLGWPVLAEPLSHLRRPGALAAGQALSADAGWLERFTPELVMQVGATPTTRATQAIVRSARSLIVVADGSLDPDPDGRAAVTSPIDAAGFAQGLLAELPDASPEPSTWLGAWQEADAAARRVVDDLLDSWDEPFEGRIARDLAAWIPAGGTLVAGSSMPIRDLDHFMAPRDGLRVLANRGASGIDGFVSTALGVAAASDAPTFALCGDLTFLYDAAALLWNARRGIHAVFVVVNNGGGAIFDFLPQRGLPEHERLFTTPHGIDIGAICLAAGLGHARVDRAAKLRDALGAAVGATGIQVIEVPSDRATNVGRHEEVAAAVAAALVPFV